MEVKNDGIIVKLFIGSVITSRIRSLLNSNDKFEDLQIIPFQGKEYIGTFMSQTEPLIPEVLKEEENIKNNLSKYFPDLNTEILPMNIFSQIFLT